MNREPLLGLLRAYPAGQALLLGSKYTVLRGTALYSEGRLLDLKWSGAALACTVAEADCRIEVSPGGDRLAFSCDCPVWTAVEQCEHVVCTMMTLKNLLDHNTLRIRGARLENRDRLAGALLGKPEALPQKTEPAIRLPGSSLVLDIDRGELEVSVRRNGKVVSEYRSDTLPFEIRRLAIAGAWGRQMTMRILLGYLRDHENSHPFVLRRDGSETIVVYDAGSPYTAKVVLDATAAGVRVERIFLREGEIIEGATAVPPLVFEPAAGRFGVTDGPAAYEMWDRLSAMAAEGGFVARTEGTADLKDGDLLPEEFFRNATFIFPVAQGKVPEGVILKSAGRETTPRPVDIGHGVSIAPDEDGADFRLQVHGTVEGTAVQAFPLLPFHHSASGVLEQAWRSKKSRTTFFRAFFAMAGADTKEEGRRAAREALQDAAFGGRRGRRTARELVGECLTQHFGRVNQCWLHRGEWVGRRVDFRRESLPFGIIREIFGDEVFCGMPSPHAVLVPGPALLAHFPALSARLHSAGIALTFKGAPVRHARWEVRIETSAYSGIDWFEIRPEIRWDGALVEDLSLEAVIERGGIVERGGELFVLETDTLRIVEMIGRILNIGGKGAALREGVVRVPRLRILDWLALRASAVAVHLPPEAEEIIRRLAGFEAILPRPIPKGIKAKLRPYQREGWSWLAFLYEHRFGACLADDMGLGKTLQAICLLAGIKEGVVRHPGKSAAGPHLVVVPPSLLHNWENEIVKFAPRLRVVHYTGTRRSTKFGDADVVLTTYALARRDIEKLRAIPFDVIVFDEAQAVKNLQAETTGAVRRLRGSFKLAMTGTPLENHVGEYFSILDLAVPGLFGDYEEFEPLLKEESSPLLDLILRRARPFVLRRTKERILKELPPKTETDIYLDLTEPQKLLYARTVRQVRGKIEEAYRTKTGPQARIIALTAILRLRQICVSPRLLAPDIKGGSPKVEFLVEQLRELEQEGHAALVFSQFTSFLDLIEEDLKKHHLAYLRLDGSTPVGQRKKRIARFQEGGAPVFLLSLKAGGQGLNLTRATYVFHLDPWWNPAVENQASDRAHRIGQRRSVTITRLLMRHTIEEKMMTLKARKSELFRAVLDDVSGRGRGARITKADFEFLLDSQTT